MSSRVPTSDDSLPPALALHINEVCNRFEEACRAGARPRAADFLDEVDEPGRIALLRELLYLEAYYHGQGRVASWSALSPGCAVTPDLGSATVSTAEVPARRPPYVGGYEVLEELGR